MSLIRTLATKPWMENTVEDIPAWGRLPLPTARVGLGVFLAVVTVLFWLLISAYLVRMSFADWRPLPEPPLLWRNTLVLVLSSMAMQGSWMNARRGRLDAARVGFLVGGFGAAVFLAGQLVAWRQLDALGYFVATNPADTFFYLMTALHGVHLLGGLVAWSITAAGLRHGFDGPRMRSRIELCTLYWHFLLVVWLVLFGLLLADNSGKIGLLDIYQAICSIGAPAR
jgi:cytochrome c oxidase subunit 3